MEKRFLVTTSDERTWNTDGKILFLGEWCKRLSRKNIWSQLDYRVLPYHWDDRNRMLSDYKYLKVIYEKYLAILSQNMNRVHDVKHSPEYWRIVVGPWLQLFINVVFDRWFSIKEALETEEISSTWVLDFGEEGMLPLGMKEMQSFLSSDSWNHHIYSQIIIANQLIPYKKIKHNLSSDSLFLNKEPSNYFKSLAKYMVSRIWSLVPDRLNKVVFICNNFSKGDLFRLQISLGQIPYLTNSKIKLDNIPIHLDMRKSLEMGEASSEFEKVLENLIPANIPKLNVELYSELCNRVNYRFPKNISTIVTTHGYWAEDEVKLWIAEKKEQGAKLVIGQHGGLFGSGLIEQSEEHQIRISDQYFTWGWKDEKHDHVRPLTPPKLASIKKRGAHPKANGPILWVWGATFPRFYYRMYSIPMAPQCLEYIKDQIEFGKNVSKEVIEMLKLRLRPTGKFFWEEDHYFQEAGLDKIVERSKKGLHEHLNESRLCLTTDNSTVFLETLAINFPTILFWNPKHWELRSKAKPFYDQLRRVNILHDSPKSAAATVNEIYQDPLDWWFQPERQKARELFCEEFARIRPNWLVEWKNELKPLSSEG